MAQWPPGKRADAEEEEEDDEEEQLQGIASADGKNELKICKNERWGGELAVVIANHFNEQFIPKYDTFSYYKHISHSQSPTGFFSSLSFLPSFPRPSTQFYSAAFFSQSKTRIIPKLPPSHYITRPMTAHSLQSAIPG